MSEQVQKQTQINIKCLNGFKYNVQFHMCLLISIKHHSSFKKIKLHERLNVDRTKIGTKILMVLCTMYNFICVCYIVSVTQKQESYPCIEQNSKQSPWLYKFINFTIHNCVCDSPMSKTCDKLMFMNIAHQWAHTWHYQNT